MKRLFNLLFVSFLLIALQANAQLKIYGITYQNGANNLGTIYSVNPDGSSFTKLYDFTGSTGGTPQGQLVKFGTKLAGITTSGGTNNKGTLYSVNTDGTGYTVLYNFSTTTTSDGPFLASDGKLYAVDGSFLLVINANGTIASNPTICFTDSYQAPSWNTFVLSQPNPIVNTIKVYVNGAELSAGEFIYDPGPNTVFIPGFRSGDVRIDFCVLGSGTLATAGVTSFSPLIELPGGDLAGVAREGGANNYGYYFKIKKDGSGFTNLHDFTLEEGATPNTLLLASDGRLYITCRSGGNLNAGYSGGYGSIISMNPDGTGVTSVFEWTDDGILNGNIGKQPYWGVTEGNDGLLYGTTSFHNGWSQGNAPSGLAFKVKKDGTGYTPLYFFNSSGTTGATPLGGVVQLTDGSLISTTYSGGISPGGGGIFKINPDGTGFTSLKYFDTNSGSNPGRTQPLLIYTGTKKNQSISFNLQATAGAGDAPIALNATASSGLPVWQYTSSNPVIAEVQGNQLLVKSVGSVTITAKQAGNYEFNAAPNVMRTLICNSAPFSGRTIETSGISARQILTNYPSSPTGVYWLDPDGAAGNAPFQAYCDMTTQGGGWTLGLKTWYQAGHYQNIGAVGTVADALTLKGNPYKLSDQSIRDLIGTSNSFDVMVSQTGYNSFYSTGNFEYVILNDYTGVWRWDQAMAASSTPTVLRSYRASDGALAWEGEFQFGLGGAGINGTVIVSGPNPAGGSGCAINMGTDSNPGWHHFYMAETNSDSYLYLCNGPQHSSGVAMNHVYWFRSNEAQTAPVFGPAYVTMPVDNANGLNVTLNATVKAVTGATSYTIELNTLSNFTGASIVLSGTGRTKKFTGLAYNTTYYSRVQTNLSPNWGKSTMFTTGTPESFAFVKTPANNAIGQQVNVTVALNAVIGATDYEVELNTASDFSGTALMASGTKTSYPYSGLAFSTVYYSRVKTNLSPNWGPTRSFTTGTAQQLSYVTTPKDNAINSTWRPGFTVNNIGATSYTVEVSPVSDFLSGVVSATSATIKVNLANSLAYNTQYYTRVTSNLTPGLYGSVRSFTTGNPESFSFITSPKNLATNVPYITNITANVVPDAVSYTIEVNESIDFTGAGQIKPGGKTIAFTLDEDTQYFARVSTDLDPGNWGTVSSFTTGNPLSLAFVTSPKNGGVGVPTTVKVTSNAVPNATSYTIELNTAADFTGTSIELTSAPGSRSVTFTGLSSSTTYFTRVKTNVRPGEWGTTSTSFKTAAPGARTGNDWMGEEVDEEEVLFEAPTVNVYPVPFTNRLYVHPQTAKQMQAQLRLYDMTGKELITHMGNTNNLMEIETTDWAPGLYVIKVATPEGIEVKKVMKQ